jgi:endogenous inhibitor of DNA gyrase (YacG/DUF329 family)
MSRPAKADSCPLCGKPANAADKPFCSRGCRDRDLLNWLGDGYRMPGPVADPDAAEAQDDGLDSERQAPL